MTKPDLGHGDPPVSRRAEFWDVKKLASLYGSQKAGVKISAAGPNPSIRGVGAPMDGLSALPWTARWCQGTLPCRLAAGIGLWQPSRSASLVPSVHGGRGRFQSIQAGSPGST